MHDLEIRDAQLIFNAVWSDLEKDLGRENLSFPQEIFWLNGAPGAGKGTHTRYILAHRGYHDKPIVMSDLLQSPEARKRMDAGLLVGDKEVTELLFRKLLEPQYAAGTVVDGFPRTMVQVECVKLLHAKLNELRRDYVHTALESRFRKPRFHVLVLFVDEAESIRRQLERGQKALAHNEQVKASGIGELEEVRKTDVDEEAARIRYRTFREKTYEALLSLRQDFHFHYINSTGAFEKVQQRILNELQYQSSLELDQATYDRLACIPVASDILLHARQDLVTRLDDYEKNHTALFKQVVDVVNFKFMPIIFRHAISGRAHVNSEDAVFDNPIALAMLIDIFSERGFHAVVDVHREEIPDSVDPVTHKINCRTKKVYRVHVWFPGSEIRRGRR